MKTYLQHPIDYAKTLKLQFRVGTWTCKKEEKSYTSYREEEEHAQMCPCGQKENRIHLVGERTYNKEPDVLDDMRKIGEFGMEKFCTLDISQETITILENRWWPQTAKQEGIRYAKVYL